VYVADTHALVHYSFIRKPVLGRNARKAFEKADAGETIIFIPSVVLWEISLLAELGRVQLLQTFEHWCRSLDNKPGFSIVSLEWLDIKESRHLPFSDPFDCFIAGTALRLDAPLITRDREIVDSNRVPTIW
jgi:PIN domain nuclease of toxin-antitoxin system